MPYLSLIIPVYNVEIYIHECFESIKSQSFRDVQIIFVDDCSTDKSYEFIQQFKREDSRVEIYRLEQNSGPAKARNYGVIKAKGDYVQFVDADDILPKNALENLLKATSLTKPDIVRGNGIVFQDMEPSIFSPMPHIHQVQDASHLRYRGDNFHGLPWFHHVFLFKRQFLLDNNLCYPDIRCGEDPIFLLKALLVAGEVGTVAAVVYQYRIYNKKGGRFKSLSVYRDYFSHYIELKNIWLEQGMYLEWQEYLDKTFWGFWMNNAAKNRQSILDNYDSIQSLFIDLSADYLLDLDGNKKVFVSEICELDVLEFKTFFPPDFNYFH